MAGRERWRTETLIIRALRATSEESRWKCVTVLHKRGTKEVFDAVVDLCGSDHRERRCLGYDILGQLGVPQRASPTEARDFLHAGLLQETVEVVIKAILFALGHTQETEDGTGIDTIASLATHPHEDVRFGVVFALLGHTDQRSIETLVELSSDEDVDVRDWATFGLGTQIEEDSEEIRAALRARLEDSDPETRWEAIVGLAQRDRASVRAILLEELADDNPQRCWFDAAAEAKDPALLPRLREIRERLDDVDAVNQDWLRGLDLAITSAAGSNS